MVKRKGKKIFLFETKPWWTQVTVTPDLTRIAVFNRGTLKGLKPSTPWGGQINPKSCEGLNEEWKKVQKNAEKKQTSLIINKIIPIFKPSIIRLLYSPATPSRPTSRHQKNLIINKIKKIKKKFIIKPNLNQKIIDKTILKLKNPHKIGQGDILTKWIIVVIYIDPSSK